MGKKKSKDNIIDPAAIKANVAELDKNIDFERLESGLPEEQRQQVAETAKEWLDIDRVEGKGGKPIDLSADVREGLADLAKRALVVQAVSSNNALDGVYLNGTVVDQIKKLLKECGAERGFMGWCEKQGWSRATMYRDLKLAKHFSERIKECVGISENKLNTCATEKKTIEWVLDHKQALIEAPNVEAVRHICKGQSSEESATSTDEEHFEPRTRFSSYMRSGYLVVRIEGLTEGEVKEVQKWNDGLPGNQPVVSKALDTDEQEFVADNGKTNLKKSFGDPTGRRVDLFRIVVTGDAEKVDTKEEKHIPLTSAAWEKIRKALWVDGTTKLYAESPDECKLWESRLVEGEIKTFRAALA